jgi:hypothetical protein
MEDSKRMRCRKLLQSIKKRVERLVNFKDLGTSCPQDALCSFLQGEMKHRLSAAYVPAPVTRTHIDTCFVSDDKFKNAG